MAIVALLLLGGAWAGWRNAAFAIARVGRYQLTFDTRTKHTLLAKKHRQYVIELRPNRQWFMYVEANDRMPFLKGEYTVTGDEITFIYRRMRRGAYSPINHSEASLIFDPPIYMTPPVGVGRFTENGFVVRNSIPFGINARYIKIA